MTAILIVDDEDYLRVLLEQTLEDLEAAHGVRLLFAADGAEGLAMMREHRPRLVFLDIMMPRLNGFDVCRAVSQWPEAERPVIILLTARGQEADRDEGLRLGAAGYVTKPFDPDEVLEMAARS
jgi:two-component system, OmpR family, alkaline phosphatase synthesis response regulator PhoP